MLEPGSRPCQEEGIGESGRLPWRQQLRCQLPRLPLSSGPFTPNRRISSAGHSFVQDWTRTDLRSADLAVAGLGHEPSWPRQARSRGQLDMEFLVTLVGFIALLMAMNARKRIASLQLELTAQLARLGRLEDALDALRRRHPDAPLPGAPSTAAIQDPLPSEVASEASRPSGPGSGSACQPYRP